METFIGRGRALPNREEQRAQKRAPIFLVCLVVFVLVSGFGVAGALTRQGKETINVFYRNIKIRVRGAAIPTLEEPFIYQGQVYVPLRVAAEALGQRVDWDSATSTVIIGETPDTVYLSSLEAYHQAGVLVKYDLEAPIKMGGKSYHKGVKIIADANPYLEKREFDFNLEGQFSQLSSLVGLDDSNGGRTPVTVVFVGDGRLLGTLELNKGDLPKPVSVDVRNVLRLTVQVNTVHEPLYEVIVDLADAALHK